MKTALIALLMTISFSSHAHFYISPSQISLIAPTLSSAGVTDSSRSSSERQKAAEDLIKDANEYRQTGVKSAKLQELINTIQAESEVSEAEAVDLLSEHANSIFDDEE